MNVFLPLAVEHGVQMVFAAHDHLFERFNPTNGVHMITTGGGGGLLYYVAEREAATAQVYRRSHVVDVQVDSHQLRLQAVDDNGDVFDWMFLQREISQEKTYHVPRYSPEIEENTGDDGDGNVVGQEFDFAGEGLGSVVGSHSDWRGGGRA